jgi:hypothetical protein
MQVHVAGAMSYNLWLGWTHNVLEVSRPSHIPGRLIQVSIKDDLLSFLKPET